MTTLRQAAQAALEAMTFTSHPGEGHQSAMDRFTEAHDAAVDGLTLALAAPEPEPVLHQRRMKADWNYVWTAWDDCSEATFKEVLRVPNLHDWTHQARALYAAPVAAPEQDGETTVLQAKCDAFLANTQLALDDLEAMTAQRDEYQRAADSMAMSHKVERDGLMVANRDLSNWFDALKTDHDALLVAGKLAHAYIEWSANGNWRASDGQIPTAEEVIAALKQAGMK